MGLGGLSLDKLTFDPANPDDLQNVGAWIRSSDGTLITHTTEGGKDALDVHISNTSPIDVNVIDAANHNDGTAWNAGDTGESALAVRNDADAALTGVDDGDWTPLQVNSVGRLKVDTVINAEKAEDAASASGDIGNFVLAVQQATLASSVSTDGDYAAFKLNERGALWTAPVGTVADDAADTENPVKVGSRARIGALTAISTDGDRADLLSDKYRRLYTNNGANVAMLAQAVTVGNSAAVLLASNLSGRRSIMIQNRSGKSIYIGEAGTVTTSSGLEVAAKQTLELDLGENVDIYAIGDAAGLNVRILELA